MSLKVGAVYIDIDLLGHLLLIWGEQVKFLFVNIVHALETGTLLNRPAQGAYMYLEFLLKFVKQVKGVVTLTVQFVDEHNHRSLAHAAHLHEAAGLQLNALGTVNHDDYAVHGCERTERILGKVLVTRGVQNVYLVTFIIKFHYRCGNRDTTLFLYIHPVRCGCLAYLVGLDGSGNLYLAAEQQEFLSKCGLTGIRVRYYRKCASSVNLFNHNITLNPKCPPYPRGRALPAFL